MDTMIPLDCGNPRCPMCNEHRGYQPSTPLITDPPQGGTGVRLHVEPFPHVWEEHLKKRRIKMGDEWHKIVVECEKILGCEDTAESAHASNLPNLVRNVKNDLEACRQASKKFLTLYDNIDSDPYTLESALHEVRKIVGRE